MFPLRILRRRRVLYVAVLVLFLLGCLATFKVISSSEKSRDVSPKVLNPREREEDLKLKISDDALPSETNQMNQEANHDDGDKETMEMIHINHATEEKLNTPNKEHLHQEDLLPEPNYNIHIFYYAWYGNPEHDGKYVHWNHRFLPHWNPDIAKRYRNVLIPLLMTLVPISILH